MAEIEEDDSVQKISGTIYDVPEWQRDNEYILTGYRVNYKDHSDAIKSIVQCHNETFNVWSHLIGALSFAALILITVVFFQNF